MDKGFWKAGHPPTLLSAFLYFDLSFMVWVLLGPLAVHIARDLGLTPAQKGLMVATPLLAGALLRLVMGVLVDHLRPKRAGAIGQLIVMAALAVAWLAGVHSFGQVMLLAVFLGVAGASFAVALPLASRWYPPHYQGAAMGIAGAGNSGTAIAALFAPSLAKAFGWNAVFGLALAPLALVFLVYLAFARDSPDCPPAKKLSAYLAVLRDRDAWWFMFFYCVTFGGFSGLASSLTVYFNDQYGLDPVKAGFYTALCVFAGSLMRPIGGALADRVGGIRSLLVLYTLASACLWLVGRDLPEAWMALTALVAGMLWLGMGNGAVFQLVPQRFRREIGVMTGLVGMAGGIGGFLLAAGLGYSKQLTGGYSTGLTIFAALALLAWVGLLSVKQRWRTTWGAVHIAGARV
ncbi:nitrate/nitrite transporter [Chitinimonas koreensis]|uniref:nitrate/nitrite transporter n=1 Tax=Chitinimonas koreensis TaxID=356302 RepID=UPI00042A75DC|nr:nitrate/nitrite transporter [Chitinimonas koreensis]QNM97767.1 NarK/NasA family nitrate transporter [Chitinimonas koreensis]